MKKLLIILLFSATLTNAQSWWWAWGGDNLQSLFALDLDGSTEYAYVNDPNGLDLNGSERITNSYDADFGASGNWSGLTVGSGVGTFTDTATLSASNFTDLVDGHNYTLQLDASSLASSDLKVKVGNDSTTHTTTGTSATKAHTFTYDSTGGNNQDIQLIGDGTDTWTVDNVSLTEAYDLEIEGWFKLDQIFDNNHTFFTLFNDYDNRLRVYSYTNGNIYTLWENKNNSNVGSYDLPDTSIFNYYKVVYNVATSTIKLYVNNSLGSTNSNIINTGNHTFAKFQIGADGANNNKFDGQIGKITFTRKDGTGATVNTSIYDWSGNADTFLDDKGTNFNHLTGVNITTDDVIEYQGEYTE
jgi:hypothetical protein